MSNFDRSLIQSRVQHAKEALALAERELEETVHEIRAAPRADKRHIGERIERAFDTLKKARKHLIELEELLAAD